MYKENEKVELKREIIDEVKNEIVAFLNTNGGTIYIGVNDDGSINSDFLLQNKDDNMLKISSWLQDAFFPLPSTLVSFRYNEDDVLEINISEGTKKPYYLREKGPKPSGVYKRHGTSTRKCSEEEILAMIMESNSYDFETDISEEQNLTFKFFKNKCEEYNISYNEKQLISLGLKNTKGLYTNLGLMMSDNSPFEVKLAEYDDEMNFKLKKTFGGSLLKVIEDTQDQVKRMNDASAIIDAKTWKRIEKDSYPEKALREIILNAFCHSNYFIRSNIKIEFYKDKAKITSPGGLYKSNIEDMLKGVQTYRNQRLVHLLDKLDYIENFGTGIPRTLESYESSSRKPEFYNSENFFIVYLPNLNYNVNSVDQINDQINDLGLEILQIINNNGGIKVQGIYDLLTRTHNDITLDVVRNSIKRDIKQYIELRGSKKTGGYYIKR